MLLSLSTTNKKFENKKRVERRNQQDMVLVKFWSIVGKNWIIMSSLSTSNIELWIHTASVLRITSIESLAKFKYFEAYLEREWQYQILTIKTDQSQIIIRFIISFFTLLPCRDSSYKYEIRPRRLALKHRQKRRKTTKKTANWGAGFGWGKFRRQNRLSRHINWTGKGKYGIKFNKTKISITFSNIFERMYRDLQNNTFSM